MSGPHPSFAPAGTCLLGKTSNLTTAYCLLFKSPFAKGGFRGISRRPIKSPLPPLVQGGLKKPGDTAPSNFQRPFLVPKLQLGNPLVGKGSPPETCIMRKTRNSKLETGNWELTPGHCSRSATAALPHRIILKIKRLAAKTPPLLSGAPAAQFAEKIFPAARRSRPDFSPVPSSPSKMTLNDFKC